MVLVSHQVVAYPLGSTQVPGPVKQQDDRWKREQLESPAADDRAVPGAGLPSGSPAEVQDVALRTGETEELMKTTAKVGRQAGAIVGLHYYPVKGCAGISVRKAVLTPAGLTHDRTFMIIDDQGVFNSQRRDPRLALIHPEVDAGGEHLTLTAPAAGTIRVEVDLASTRCDVHLFGVRYQGIDQGDAVAGWLSEVLGTPSRLVRVPPEHDRVTDGAIPGTSAYADSCPLLVTSLASLDVLNKRLAERGHEPLPMNRFRPNIIVGGWDEPHIEDQARLVNAGAAELGYAKLATRCAVTTIDQDTAVKTGPEPLRTLAGYRRASKGGVAFGVKFAVLRDGTLSVGDPVVVNSWGESEL